MNIKRVYNRCKLEGYGAYDSNNGIKGVFKVIDISASGISINLEQTLNEGQLLEMDIKFDNIVDINLKTKGRVVRQIINNKSHFSYGVSFVDFSDTKKVQLDEILRHTCTIDSVQGVNRCDDGDCGFLKN